MAEIIDLGTASAAGGFAFAAAGPDVSDLDRSALGRSALGRLGGDEIANEAGEGLRHLVGKRHHPSRQFAQDAAGDGRSDPRSDRMNMRVARWSNDQRGTLDVPQPVLHPVAIHHAMAFRCLLYTSDAADE